MKKLFLFSVAVLFLAAVSQAKEGCVVKLTNGTIQQCDGIEASANGDLSVRSGKFTNKIKKKDYIYAHIPMPAELKTALSKLKTKNYKEAISAAVQGQAKYKALGWNLFCSMVKAEAENGLGEQAEALKTLEECAGYEITNPEEEKYRDECQRVMSSIYFDMKKYKECAEVLNKIAYSKSPEVAAYALNKQGDIFYNEGEKNRAVIKYLQTVYLMKSVGNERAEALLKAANTLKELNDNRSAKFAAMLKKDYPQSPYVSQLK
ncbi:MAG: hypothetical protein A2020_01245 [Lentisphaerae bacterium GWF2_45_14]|nr:MAG: hypothetical protein A2020_01245 [Lentisphaerae bacterium GWF2_45_14]